MNTLNTRGSENRKQLKNTSQWLNTGSKYAMSQWVFTNGVDRNTRWWFARNIVHEMSWNTTINLLLEIIYYFFSFANWSVYVTKKIHFSHFSNFLSNLICIFSFNCHYTCGISFYSYYLTFQIFTLSEIFKCFSTISCHSHYCDRITLYRTLNIRHMSPKHNKLKISIKKCMLDSFCFTLDIFIFTAIYCTKNFIVILTTDR